MIPILVTHWAKTHARTEYLGRTLDSLSRGFPSSPVVVSFEPKSVSPAFADSMRVVRDRRRTTAIVHPVKGSRVDVHLDWALDKVCRSPVLYVQDDFVFNDDAEFDLREALDFMEDRRASLLRLVVAAPHDTAKRVVLDGQPFDLIEPGGPNGEHFYSHNPAIHSPRLREGVGRFVIPGSTPWEWKYSIRASAAFRQDRCRIYATKSNLFTHIGDDRTIPASEQRLGELGSEFAIAPDLIWAIREMIADGATLVEFGSGEGSAALSRYYKVHSIEDCMQWLNRFDGPTYHFAPLVRDWYSRDAVDDIFEEIGPFDVLLIDGPSSARGDRRGVVAALGSILRERPRLIVVDDTHREAEQWVSDEVLRFVGGGSRRRVEARAAAVGVSAERSFDLIVPG